MNSEEYPEWIKQVVDWQKLYTPEQSMALAQEIAHQNVLQNGGPFAAVIGDNSGRIYSVGSNRVVASHDSTAHAEILAIRLTQKSLQTFDLRTSDLPPFYLYSSGAPCIMCFGAIWWAGLSRVYSSAAVEDAEKVGFSEGPVSDHLWQTLKQEKGTEYLPNFCRNNKALAPFQEFKRVGTLY